MYEATVSFHTGKEEDVPMAHKRKQEEELADSDASDDSMKGGRPTLRIVLMERTEMGKNTSGDTILGKEAFLSTYLPTSVKSRCKKERAEVDGRDVYVIETQDLFDTRHSEEETKREIAKCICLSSPGPHAFLVVTQLGRVTQRALETVKKIQETFGKESDTYTMVLFTKETPQEISVEKLISESEELKRLTIQCQGGYHVFNNMAPENRTQVTELLQKIEKMVSMNGGEYYTNDMYQRAEAAIEEKRRILKEEREQRKSEAEELKKKRKDKKEQKEARWQAELVNDFIDQHTNGEYIELSAKGQHLRIVLGAVVGAAGGLMIGGPVGAVAGVVGAAVGAIWSRNKKGK